MPEQNDSQNFFLETFSLLFDRRVSAVTKMLYLGFIGLYSISPIDLIPDFLLPFGIVDDGGIILSMSYFFTQNARKQIESYVAMTDDNFPRKNDFIQRGTGNNWFFLGCIGLLAFLVGGACILVLSGVMTMSAVFSSLSNLFGGPDTARVVSPRTLVNSLQPLGQLVSIQVDVAQADIEVKVNSGGLNLCGHSAYHVAQGVIEAGIDITRVDADSIRHNPLTNAYTLVLPAPQITSCRIEYIRQYDRNGSNPTCGTDWDTVRMLAQSVATQMFATDTIEAGILSRAERETSVLMQSFVGALTGGDVTIVYDKPEAGYTLPPSCQSQLPPGWTFDEVNQTWVRSE